MVPELSTDYPYTILYHYSLSLPYRIISMDRIVSRFGTSLEIPSTQFSQAMVVKRLPAILGSVASIPHVSRSVSATCHERARVGM